MPLNKARRTDLSARIAAQGGSMFSGCRGAYPAPSEWDNVIVVVSQSHFMMLQRNLLYTALTRARKRAVIVVSGGLENKETGRIYKTALEVAVANDKIARRYSGLAERLAGVVK